MTPLELPRTLSLGFERVNGRARRNKKGAGLVPAPGYEIRLHREDRADLHGAHVRRRAVGRSRDRLVEVLGFDHVEADKLVAAA